jgi:ubiquinone/menaquinone biosynthesis C-methylase UbiE
VDKEKVRNKTYETYNKVGPDYDNWYWFKQAKKLRAELTKEVLEILERELKGKPKILDLCCGTGHLVGLLSQLGDYTGLDFAPRMISTCKERYTNKDFIVGDAEQLPFKDKSFDCVVCFWSFHHIVYPDNVLDEIKRVLKPGGFLLIATFKDAKLNLAAKLGDLVSDSYYGYATKRHSKKSMRKLMSERFKSFDIQTYPDGISLLNAMGIRFLIVSGRK